MKVLIAGAGIGGLTAALALQANGIEVTVLEAAHRLEEVGAGLQLGANAVHVLNALGLADEVNRMCFRPDAMHMRDHRSGRMITQMAFGEAYQARYGAPFLQIHRADLLDVLARAVQTRCGDVVHLGKTVRSFEQSSLGVTIQCESGEQYHADLLIGADGVRSTIRAQMQGDTAPYFTGHVAWRGVIPADRLKGRELPHVVTSWVAPHAHAITYYLRRGELFNFVGITENNQWTSESWHEQAPVEELRQAFESWHPDVRAVVAQIENPFRWALYSHDPLLQWSQGRISLLGDACHPMLPYMAQGAGMAIEDAYVLAECLSQHDANTALQIYEQKRKSRTARVQATAAQNGRIFHRAGLMRWGQDLGMKVAGMVMPDLVARRFDWIYGHDVTRS